MSGASAAAMPILGAPAACTAGPTRRRHPMTPSLSPHCLTHRPRRPLYKKGCAEIRWLAEKMGARGATLSGPAGLGDIILTCYGSLSRNRSVGVRLGAGEPLADILGSSHQVAEGVATAGVVVGLARKYRVQLPVLTAVAQILDGHISAREAVFELMNLPQIDE